MPTEEARGIAYALDAAGLEKRGGGEGPGSYDEFGLGYRFAAPGQRPATFTSPSSRFFPTASG
jgi:hypothetical protein